MDLFGFKRRRRRRLRGRPFPDQWLGVLRRNVPYYGVLTEAEQEELRGHIQVFLAEKRLQGCGGLEMTDEIRVTIAAQACILLLGRETDYYPMMKSIFVYPHAYAVDVSRQIPSVERGTVQPRLGESWYRGPVVLSWDDTRKGASDIHDGHNVVLHEFAHQLDSETGATDGAPVLAHRSMYVAWARVLGREFERLGEDIDRDRPTVLDDYAGTDPAEFFAVATEAFFEKPQALRRDRPELYEQLRGFYRQDPAARSAPTEEA
ncbi:MAG: M90 family metallopeptidase [Planctomycetota bacterium]|jgi:Mlc titration factor MtfA (ptsG expression regulator)